MYKLIRGLEDPERKSGGSLLQVTRAVLWSFLGVRRGRGLRFDAATITPIQVIAGGLIGTLCFVLILLGIVRTVLG